MMNHQLTVRKDSEIYLLDIVQVIYIESIDRKCFVYTAKEIYESDFPAVFQYLVLIVYK